MSNKTKRKGQTSVAPKPYQAQGKQKQVSNAQGTQSQTQTQTQPPRPQSQAPVQTKPQPKVVDTAEQDAKRTARMEKQIAQRAAAERRKRMRMMRRYGIIGAIVVVLLGTFLALYINEASKPGESVPLMASQHLGPNVASPVEYNSNPPTSGPHHEIPPAFKIYTEPMTKELAIHGLEDGGVIINYQPELDKPTVDKLAAIATSYLEIGGGKSHVILAPYPPGQLFHPIVLTAWRRIDRVQEFDEPRIRKFIDAYVGIDHHSGREGQRIP